MKYLEYPELEVLSRALTFELAECKVFTRLEAYSCKAVNKEKRLFKSLESSYMLSASTSPPAYLEEALSSPFGRLDQPSARKTLFLLIATLNGAFPDHDFSDVNPGDFTREGSPALVLNSLTSTLLSLRSGAVGSPHSVGSFASSLDEPLMLSSYPAHSPRAGEARKGADPAAGGAQGAAGLGARPSSLSSVLDAIMNIADCEVYTFHPDMDSDPHASAEPDEEGIDADDGDPYDEGYDDHEDAGVVSRGGTPVQDSNARMDEDTDEIMPDAPVFDEEVFGSGFGQHPGASAAGARSAAGGQSTSAPGAFGSAAAGAEEARRSAPASSPYGAAPSSVGSQSFESASATLDEEDDLGGAGAGLLWSTFAFFYNRRMKRILFVSVWSRKNAPTAWTSPSLMPAAPELNAAPSGFALPSSAYFSAPSHPHERLGEHLLTPTASPMKRSTPLQPLQRARRANAAPYTTSPRAQQARRRRAAGRDESPAPSALSPFPHVQPGRREDASPARGAPERRPGSLDALLSASAPSTSATQMLAARRSDEPPMVKRTGEARGLSHASRKRSRVSLARRGGPRS